jgi:hypothetical protein
MNLGCGRPEGDAVCAVVGVDAASAEAQDVGSHCLQRDGASEYDQITPGKPVAPFCLDGR